MAETKPTAAKRAPARRAPAAKRTSAAAKKETPAGGRGMSPEHKAALAAGREEGRTVRAYLEAVSRPKRPGRKKTPESITRQLQQVDERLRGASAADRLQLIQQRFDLKADLDRLKAESSIDLGEMEAAFVKVAAGYSERKGISYAAWREAGVPADVLRRAGIRRSRVAPAR